jgi:tetratricopeptide (TPR) repeat protein
MMEATADQRDLAAGLVWVRWLLVNGRNDEAVAKLGEIEGRALDEKEKRQLQVFRAQILARTGDVDKARDIVEGLRKEGEDFNAVLLQTEILMWGGSLKEASDFFAKHSGNKQDDTGIAFYLRGQLSRANGDFPQAIQFYERALQFTTFRTLAQNGIMASVMGIANGPPGKADKANPEAAFKEAKRLRAAHPKDPVVLLTYAIMARQLDAIYGDGGMEGALADMIRVLAEDRATAPRGPYLAAQQWVAAGRPDRARQELRGNLSHLPSVILATQLAVAQEDWTEVADDLKAVEKLQPSAADLDMWRGALHEAKGEYKEADTLYQKYVAAHPKHAAGYQALTLLNERQAKYKEAREWVDKWRAQMVEDVSAQQALVRVLAREGQLDEANKLADGFIKTAVQRTRGARDEFEAKNPITEKNPEKAKEQAERRAKDYANLLDTVELAFTMRFAAAFQQAKSYAEAEKWLTQRAMPLVDKLPEDARKVERTGLRLVQATLYLEQGRLLKEGSPERAKFMDQAIQVYDDIYKEYPGHLVAGNNLAWLLVKEKKEPARALGLVEQVRKGRLSGQAVSPERLELEFLDTLGEVYLANGMNKESLDLFKEATDKRYAREPRVLIYLGRAQAALGFRADADVTYRKVINLADERSKATADPERKDLLAKLSQDATSERKKAQGGVPK